ncbi:Histidine phosphatase, partial [Parasponia andersonii]
KGWGNPNPNNQLRSNSKTKPWKKQKPQSQPPKTPNQRPKPNPKKTPNPDKVQNNSLPMTGGAFDFKRATTSLTDDELISSPKRVTLVRHGLSTWNEESRIQDSVGIPSSERKKKGSSNMSVLTETGIRQAERCKKALANIPFDGCFSSPISRAKSTAEIIWQGREEPLVFIDSLKEAHLFFLEGMKNGQSPRFHVLFMLKYYSLEGIIYLNLKAVDAKQIYPKEYTTWREDPASFQVNGIYPLRKVWGTAREAWKEILLTPGEHFLVVTHKSILRALICTALGLGPERFRATDVNNGGITVFKFNPGGEAMLQNLNMTSHMYSDHVYLY